MMRLPDMSRLRLHTCDVPTGAKKKKKQKTGQQQPPEEEPEEPDLPHGKPGNVANDAESYKQRVRNFFNERVLTPAQRLELLAIIAAAYPQHTFPPGDWSMSALPQSLLDTIEDGDTQAGQWKWKLERLQQAIDELNKKEAASKKKKGAPGSSAQHGAQKKKKQEQREEDAENAKKPQAVMGRKELTEKEREELNKKFPDQINPDLAPRVLGAKKASSCCMQRR